MLDLYTEATRRNTGRIAALNESALQAPTPCRDWNVAALLDHLVGGMGMFATALGRPASPDGGTPATIAALADAYGSAAAATVQAFGEPAVMARTVTLPIGDIPGERVLGVILTDTVVHGWDLAVATGQDAAIDDALASMLLAGLQESVGPEMRQPDGALPFFAGPVRVSDDAPPADRLVAFLGRSPAWRAPTAAPASPS